MKIFVSHFLSMVIFSVIISTMLAFIKYDEKRDILKYGIKLLIYMIGGVIISSWIMFFL